MMPELEMLLMVCLGTYCLLGSILSNRRCRGAPFLLSNFFFSFFLSSLLLSSVCFFIFQPFLFSNFFCNQRISTSDIQIHVLCSRSFTVDKIPNYFLHSCQILVLKTQVLSTGDLFVLWQCLQPLIRDQGPVALHCLDTHRELLLSLGLSQSLCVHISVPRATLFAFTLVFSAWREHLFSNASWFLQKALLLLLVCRQPESLSVNKVAVKSILSYSLRTLGAFQELEKKASELKLNLCINSCTSLGIS